MYKKITGEIEILHIFCKIFPKSIRDRFMVSESLRAARLPTDCVPENALTIVPRIVAGKAIRERDTIENSFLQAHRSVADCNEHGRRIFGWDQRETMENCAAVYVAKQCASRRSKIETILAQANPFRFVRLRSIA